MNFIVSFFLWTLHGGLAARMGVGGMDMGKVINKLDSLLQSRGDTHAEILSQLAITPGVDVKSVIDQMSDDVKAKVKAGQAATQASINKGIDELDGTTQKTVALKADADAKDGDWFACVEQEKQKKASLEAAAEALREATSTRIRLCKVQEDKKAFRVWPQAVSGFSCDLSHETSCSEEVAKYSSKLNDMISAVQSSESAASDEYKQAKQACDLAKEDEEQKTAAHANATHAFQYQQKECLQKRDVRRESMCLFGEELQVKCRQVSEFKAFIAEVDAAKGSEHSHPDRVQEWSTADLIRCMVSEGSELDANLLKTCEEKVNYGRDIGEFSKRAEDLAKLTSPANFTCSEDSITFQGRTWEVPEDADSSEYTVKDFHPNLKLEDDQNPFGLCADPVKTCGGNGFGNMCHFPFTYEGNTYHACTKVGHKQPWCSIDAEYRGRWGNCECR